MESSFVEELQIIIKEAQEPNPEEGLEAALTGLAGTMGGGAVGGVSAVPLALSIKGSTAKVGPKTLMKNMDVDPSTVRIKHSPFVTEAKYVPDLSQKAGPKRVDRVHANVRRNPEFLAHELGHYKLHRGKLGRGLMAARVLGPLAGLVGSTALASNEDTRAYAPAAIAAGYLPMIADEAGASIHGIRGLMRSGVKGRDLAKAVSTLGKAFGTYGLGAAGATGGTYLGAKLYDKYKSKS